MDALVAGDDLDIVGELFERGRSTHVTALHGSTDSQLLDALLDCHNPSVTRAAASEPFRRRRSPRNRFNDDCGDPVRLAFDSVQQPGRQRTSMSPSLKPSSSPPTYATPTSASKRIKPRWVDTEPPPALFSFQSTEDLQLRSSERTIRRSSAQSFMGDERSCSRREKKGLSPLLNWVHGRWIP